MTALTPEFEESSHTYTLAGRKLPSVTQILDKMIPRQYNISDWYKGRGTAIHKAVQLSAAGILDRDRWRRDLLDVLGPELTQVIENKFEAADEFLRETGFTVLESEVRLASKVHQFAGTIDAICQSAKNPLVIVDWKSSLDSRVELQLGGYAVLYGSENRPACAVELRDDGDYRMHFYDGPKVRHYAREFLAIRSAYGSIESRNLFPRKESSNGNH